MMIAKGGFGIILFHDALRDNMYMKLTKLAISSPLGLFFPYYE